MASVDPQGRLSRETISALVTDLAANKYWGVLRAKDAEAAKEFDFASGGMRVTSLGNRKGAPLGQILVRRGAIRSDGIEKALHAQQERGGLFGEVCISLHLIDEETRETAVREQVLAEWADLYYWNGARYEYATGQARPASADFDARRRQAGVKPVSWTGPIGKLLGDARQAVIEFDTVQRDVGSGETVYGFTESARDKLWKQGGFQRLVESDQRVCVLLDGKKTLSEIIAKVPLGWAETLRIIHKLLKAGALRKLSG